MLFDTLKPLPAAPRAAEKALETVLFRLPLPGGLACGGCTRFRPINPFPSAAGRCKLGIKPGIVGRETTACGLHRAKGAPARFQNKPVRP